MPQLVGKSENISKAGTFSGIKFLYERVNPKDPYEHFIVYKFYGSSYFEIITVARRLGRRFRVY